MQKDTYSEAIERIADAISESRKVFSRFTAGKIEAEYKSGHDPVTEADRELDSVLRECLLREGEGWLSEESADDLTRLKFDRVWVVDPLDGTREFVAGIPEFCVSIALVENGRPIAGGICNPATNEVFIGSVTSGITYNGSQAQTSRRTDLEGAVILASRSETNRGEWRTFENAPFKVQPMGSVAYKLARVAAGLADATFTLTPKHEWDIAAGAALVLSAGGYVRGLDQGDLRCNQQNPLIPGLIACSDGLKDELMRFLAPYLQVAEKR